MPEVDQRFPKTSRLLDSTAFARVFEKPDFRVSNQYFLILGSRSQLETARLGIVVAKKNVAQANQRNRIKRLVREAFRTRRSTVAPVDLVVLARKGLHLLENSECRSYIHDLMEEIEKKNPST